MKTKMILILVFASYSICNGQSDSITQNKNIYGVNLGCVLYGAMHSLDYYSNFSVERKKHCFAFGPIIGLNLRLVKDYDIYPITGNYKINGLHLIYQKNPNTKGKVFDFYFQNECIARYYTNNGATDWYISSPPPYTPYKGRLIEFADYIGYGFKMKFLKNFYINQSIGVGITYRKTVIEYAVDGYDINKKETQPSFIIKMGLGYNFNRK